MKNQSKEKPKPKRFCPKRFARFAWILWLRMMNSVFNCFCYFLIENVLVPQKSHVKGLHVQMHFYLSLTIGHGFWCTLIAVNNSDNNKRYERSVSKEKGNVQPCLVKCFNLISFRCSFKTEENPQPQQNSTKCWKITKILSCKTLLARPSNTVTKTKRGRWSAMMAYAPTAKRERRWRPRRRRTGDAHHAKTQNAFLRAFLRHFIRLSVSTFALPVGQNP